MFCQSQAYLTENKSEKARIFWLIFFPKRARGVQRTARISKSGFKKAKLATLLHKN